MKLPFSALALLLFLPQEPAVDVIILKDGSQRSGIIEEENDSVVVLNVLIKGSKGETVGSAKSTIAKENIAEIKRMSAEARAKAQGKAAAFTDRAKERRERRAKIVVAKATMGGRAGLIAFGDYFDVFTTSDEDFARDACDAMQQMFEGYLRHFKLRTKTTAKIPVTILADRREYDDALTARFGGTIGNPAFYDPKANEIVGYNCIQKEEAAQAKAEILDLQKRIENFRREIVAEESRVDKLVKQGRQAIIDKATDAKNSLRKENPSNLNELLREVDRWKESRLEALKDAEKRYDAELREYRKKATAAIEECDKSIRKNTQVLREQNRVMFEMLFHEGFHAFAQTRLFVEKEIPRWLNEGMASHYEMSVVEAGELIHGSPNRALLKVFKDQQAKGALPKLADVLRGGGEMFIVTHREALDRSNGSYAVSWAMAHYLSSRVTADQMDAYVGDVTGGKDPVAALEKMLGKPIGTIQGELNTHVAALK